jgi:hypothetical protein
VIAVDERDAVAALIDRIVAGAAIPSRRERDDLRRELQTHFDDVARTCGSIEKAIAAFGPPEEVVSQLRDVYRAQRLVGHAIRIGAGLTASMLAALVIELGINGAHALHNVALLSGGVVVILVMSHEAARHRPRPSTTASRIVRWATGFLSLAAVEYGLHNYLGVPFSATRATAAGAVLVIVAAATALITAGADRAFAMFIHPHDV